MAEDNLSKHPKVGVSLSTDTEYIKCLLPLLARGEIQALEWSFDTIINEQLQPDWLPELLTSFAQNDSLLGHGVCYSLMDAKWTHKQDWWLKQLKQTLTKYNYNHITEHFGFMSSGDYHKGCPLPTPLNKKSLAVGVDRLIRIQEIAKRPVGIENLAFAFSKDDVSRQGEFLEKLIAPINGFIILDLHNLYCQSHNFNIEIMQLINRYPLELVKEIHISGGSWEEEIYGNGHIRRDTHDGDVPEVIFEVLPQVLKKCKATEYIILERLEQTIYSEEATTNFHNDFYRLKQIINNLNITYFKKDWGIDIQSNQPPIFDPQLYQEQKDLCEHLINAQNFKDVTDNFKHWGSASWKPEMIETAMKLITKWNSNH